MRNNPIAANRIRPYADASPLARNTSLQRLGGGEHATARGAKWNFRVYLPTFAVSEKPHQTAFSGDSVFPTPTDADQGNPGTSASISAEDLDSDSIEVKCRILEAVLWVAREPLSARKLAALAGLADPTQARTLARRLNESYDSVGHAFRIEEVAGGMQMLSRPQFAHWLRRLDHVPSEELLSQGMLESLSIIAYRQPTTRAEIEAIRGVNSDEVLRQLMQRDLVRICGRHEDLGRPYLYGTTKRFLQLFGLQSLDNLPRAQKIRQAEAEIASRLAANNPLVAEENTANIDHPANSVATSEQSSDTIFVSDD